jgi:hypothetical protein
VLHVKKARIRLVAIVASLAGFLLSSGAGFGGR